MPRGYKRRRRSRKRFGRNKRPSLRFASRVVSALASTQPEKTIIVHDSFSIASLLNQQVIAGIGAVGAFQRQANDTCVSVQSTYKDMFATGTRFQDPFSATFTTSTLNNVTSGRPFTKIRVLQQKLRLMMTNSSTSTMFIEFYKCLPRMDIDLLSSDAAGTRTLSNLFNVASDYTDLTIAGLTGTSTAGTDPTSGNPGLTLYDNPRLTRMFYIKRIGMKRLEAGANAIFMAKTKKPFDYTPFDNNDLNTLNNVIWKQGYTQLFVVRLWGEMVTGTTSACMAPVKLVVGQIHRTKWAFATDPFYSSVAQLATDANTIGNGTLPVMILQEEPVGGTFTGVSAATL